MATFILIFIAACLTVCLVVKAYRDFYSERVIWSLIRYGGGGAVFTPRPMTEEKAVAWAMALGSVMYVDRQRHIIFYRS